MNYLVIDLEMCKVEKHYRTKKYHYANEIIQIGAVLLDEEYRQIDVFDQFVRPEYGVIDRFIQNFTGIKNTNVKHASLLKDVLLQLIERIGDREYQVLAWSNTDYHQLLHEVKCKDIDDKTIQDFLEEERWLDYQDLFSKRYELGRAVSLEEALMLCDINTDGRLHNGLSDAIHTAKIIRKLETNPEFKLLNFEKFVIGETEPLQTCLGDLFANLDIKWE